MAGMRYQNMLDAWKQGHETSANNMSHFVLNFEICKQINPQGESERDQRSDLAGGKNSHSIPTTNNKHRTERPHSDHNYIIIIIATALLFIHGDCTTTLTQPSSQIPHFLSCSVSTIVLAYFDNSEQRDKRPRTNQRERVLIFRWNLAQV